MAVKWPDIYPHPSVIGYSIVPDDTIARTQMDAGVARQRRRFSSVPWHAKVKWIMPQEIFGSFEAWYRYKAKEGVEWIEIKLQNGLGYEKTESRFLKPYVSRLISRDVWEVTANLEIREMQVLSQNALSSLLDLGLSAQQVVHIDNLLHGFIHVTKPDTGYEW